MAFVYTDVLRTFMLAEALVHEVRHALRGLRRAPLFTAGVAGTMGIGLGVLCSVFTIVNAYLFKSVDLPEPRQLHGLSWETAAHKRPAFSLADFDALADRSAPFAYVAGVSTVSTTYQGSSIAGHGVTRDYFTLLAAPAALGRTLGPGDFARPEPAAVLVLSHEGWRTHFGADPGIVGKEVTLAGTTFAIIGVTRPGAVLPGDEIVSFWTPLAMTSAFEGAELASNATRRLAVIGRRRPDVTAAQVDAWFETWLRQRFPAGDELAPIRTRVESLSTRIPLTRGTVAASFLLLISAFGLVLLVACANVTNMLLARGVGRQRELGVRLSLGASRSRVIGQLLVESLVLSIPAAMVGLGLTMFTARAFPRIVTATLPGGAEAMAQVLAPFDPDLRVVALLVGAGVFASLLVGLSPALQLSRPNLVDAVRGQLAPGLQVSRLHNAFVVVQIAACVLFLVGAVALVVESRRMANAETGLEYERILDVRISPGARASAAAVLAARSDVERVAAVWRPPLISPMWLMRVTPLPGGGQASVGFMGVAPEYFATLGVAIRRGRAFSALEAEQGAAVAVISEATAHAFWPGQDPIGRRFEILPATDTSLPRPAASRVTVVGVAEDVVNGTLLDGVAPTSVYFPTTTQSADAARLLVRTRGDAAMAVRSIATAIEAQFPTASFRIEPLRLHAAIQVWSFRAFSAAALIPALIGLLLAFSGTFAVVSFVMAQRTREFGIRMALGASAGHIIRRVVGRTVGTASIAAAVGLLASVAMIRGIGAFFHASPALNPAVYIGAIAVVVLASAMAALVPALRAIRLDPSSALRAD